MIDILAGFAALSVIALCVGWLQVKEWITLARMLQPESLSRVAELSGAETELEYYQ